MANDRSSTPVMFANNLDFIEQTKMILLFIQAKHKWIWNVWLKRAIMFQGG